MTATIRVLRSEFDHARADWMRKAARGMRVVVVHDQTGEVSMVIGGVLTEGETMTKCTKHIHVGDRCYVCANLDTEEAIAALLALGEAREAWAPFRDDDESVFGQHIVDAARRALDVAESNVEALADRLHSERKAGG